MSEQDGLPEVASEKMVLTLQTLSDEFDRRTLERHQKGAEKYGAVNYLSIDSIEMMIEEVLDLANYARYTYIKLRLLQESVHEMVQPKEDSGFQRN